jgi:hypothetical protein
VLGQGVQVVGHCPELVTMRLGDHDQSACACRDCVGETAGQVVVIGSAVLVLDDERRAFVTVRDDVDGTATIGRHFHLTDGQKVDTDRVAERVELLGQQRREVRRLTPPRLPQLPEREPRHLRHEAWV